MFSDEMIQKRVKWACQRKLKLSMEEAAERCGNKPDDVLLYVCSNCKFLHFGHKPNWELTSDELSEKARAKKLAFEHSRRVQQAYDSRRVLARSESKRDYQPDRPKHSGRVFDSSTQQEVKAHYPAVYYPQGHVTG